MNVVGNMMIFVNEYEDDKGNSFNIMSTSFQKVDEDKTVKARAYANVYFSNTAKTEFNLIDWVESDDYNAKRICVTDGWLTVRSVKKDDNLGVLAIFVNHLAEWKKTEAKEGNKPKNGKSRPKLKGE